MFAVSAFSCFIVANTLKGMLIVYSGSSCIITGGRPTILLDAAVRQVFFHCTSLSELIIHSYVHSLTYSKIHSVTISEYLLSAAPYAIAFY